MQALVFEMLVRSGHSHLPKCIALQFIVVENYVCTHLFGASYTSTHLLRSYLREPQGGEKASAVRNGRAYCYNKVVNRVAPE